MKPWTLPFSSVIAIITIMLQIVLIIKDYKRAVEETAFVRLQVSPSVSCVKLSHITVSPTSLIMLSCFSASSLAAQDYNYNHYHQHHQHHHHHHHHITNNKVNDNNINNNYPIGEQHSEWHRCDGQTAAWHQGGNPG